MTDVNDYIRAAVAAKQAGDMAAYARLFAKATSMQQQYDPTEGMSGPQKFAAGMGQGATNVVRQAGNILGRNSNEQMAEWKRQDAPLLDTPAGKWGQFAGEVAATAPIGGVVGSLARRGASKAGARVLTRALSGTVGQGATQGAAIGGLTADPGERGSGAAWGGLLGGALPFTAGKASSLITKGINPSAAAKYLMRRGVDLTPGQMNPNSTLGMLEEAATSVPFVGTVLKNSRKKASEGWQREVMREATAPGQAATTNLTDAYASFKPGYDKVKGFPVRPAVMSATGPDVPLASFPKARGLFEKAARDPGVMADTSSRKTVNDWLQNELTRLPKDPKLQSDHLLVLRSSIRDQRRALANSANPPEAQLRMLKSAENAVTDVLESQLPANAIAANRAADRGYSKWKTVANATRRAGDQEAGMTPSHLSAAVKQTTPHDVYARGGGGELRKLAGTGKHALDTHVPLTGARVATLGPLAYALGPAGSAIVGGGTALAAGTKTGRKFLGAQFPAQQGAQRLIAGAKRKLGPAGRERLQALINALAANAGDTTRNTDDAP